MNDVKEALKELREGWERANEKVRGMFGTAYIVDEMSFLFSGEEMMWRFVEDVVQQPGYELFNVARDFVTARPVPAAYSVRYLFLRTPFEYRIELMKLEHGYSPIHSAVSLADDENIVIGVHASFKVPDVDSYASVNATLRREGWECAQRCDSSYGKFSYWNHEDFDNWFIKPRVNLRDSEESGDE